jgi:radical SAM-linked protein
MKVRIKFTKEGPVKFIGHLDTMRYFQKAIRRAQLPVAYSGGYSPHMIMSFAAPLGVGIESLGEYFDVEFKEPVSSREIVDRLNDTMVEGIRILSAREVEEGKAGKAMSLVAAADYHVYFREGKEPCVGWQSRLGDFCRQEQILVTKETKKGEKEVDIRPFIYELKLEENGLIFMKLASASANYTRPDTVMDAFLCYLDVEAQPWSYQTIRLETYADKGTEEEHKFLPLEALGEEIR